MTKNLETMKKMSNCIEEFDGVLYRRLVIDPKEKEWAYVSQLLKDPRYGIEPDATSRIITIQAVDKARSNIHREEVVSTYKVILDRVDSDIDGIELFKKIG